MTSSTVMATLHNEDADRCVKIMKRPDGTFGFQEFRREPEDAGRWTLVRDSRGSVYATQGQAVAAARDGIAWFRDRRDGASETSPSVGKGVVTSLHNDDVDRCVDIIKHPDGTFGFKEFRRDPEDRGGWTLVSYNPRATFASQEQAVAAARAAIVWLRD
jgi:hypothetical protein